MKPRSLRVARTFCPFVVNFMTVRDPIQLRTQIRFMQIKDDDTRDDRVRLVQWRRRPHHHFRLRLCHRFRSHGI